MAATQKRQTTVTLTPVVNFIEASVSKIWEKHGISCNVGQYVVICVCAVLPVRMMRIQTLKDRTMKVMMMMQQMMTDFDM